MVAKKSNGTKEGRITKAAGAISTAVFIAVLVFSCFSSLHAQTSLGGNTFEKKQAEVSKNTKNSRPRMSFVRMADFYLRNGKLVFGKLVSENKNKITIEQLDSSRIVVSTYSKREVDTRTLRIKNIPEYKYYIDMGEYFSARTWDFRDDPNDFTQAIRCYERARQSVIENQAETSGKIRQLTEKIKQLQADKKVWIREVTSSMPLKKLEFKASIETRLKELEDKINANSREVDESMERLDKFIADMKDNYRKLEKNISQINRNMSQQLDTLNDRIDTNKELINYRLWWYQQYYKPYGPRRRPEDKR